MRSSSSRSTFRNRSVTRPTTTKTPLAASAPTTQVRFSSPPALPYPLGPFLVAPTKSHNADPTRHRRLAVDGASVWRALELHEQAHADRVRPGRLSLRQTVSEPKVRGSASRLVGTAVPQSTSTCGTCCLNIIGLLTSTCFAHNRFQKRQYAPIEIVKTEKKGFGVRAGADIRA